MKKIALYILVFCLSVSVYAENVGQWEPHQSTSPVDGSKRVMISVYTQEYIMIDSNEGRELLFSLLCRDNKMYALIDFDGANVERGITDGNIMFQVDLEEPFNLPLNLSGNKDRLLVVDPIPFIKQLFGHDRLSVGFRNIYGSSVIATFNIAGVEQAVIDLRDNCSW